MVTRALSRHGGDPAYNQRCSGYQDAITCKSISDFGEFTSWLKEARGYIGEVGFPSNAEGRTQFFPDQNQWRALGEVWYKYADETSMWATAHDVSEKQLYGGYYLSLYSSRKAKDSKGKHERAISEALFQSSLVEAYPGFHRVGRGVNFSGGEMIDKPTFSNEDPGNFSPTDGPTRGKPYYWYPGIDRDSTTGQNSFEYLFERGIRLVRLGLRWERIQPSPGHPLDTMEISRYEKSVDAAGRARLQVVLDVHNYGGYYFAEGRQPLNSTGLTAEHFKDLWFRLSERFEDNRAVVAYDLMNEPFNDGGIVAAADKTEAQTWEGLTQGVVDAIRSRGDKTAISVPVYAGISTVKSSHPNGPWIEDNEEVLYTVHQYFDHYYRPGTGGGRYDLSYNQENAYYKREGF